MATSVDNLHSASVNITKQTALTEKGEVISARGDQVNMHDILSGSDPQGNYSKPGLSHCCFESGSDFGSVERTIRAKKISISYKLSGHSEGGRSGVAASAVPEPAVNNSYSVGAAGGVFSVGTAGLAVASLAVLSSSLGEVCPAPDDGGVSKLPRMIGNPSLALPMITTFELLDCES